MEVKVSVQYEGFDGVICGEVDKRIFSRLWIAMIRVIEIVCPKREVILAPQNSVVIEENSNQEPEVCVSRRIMKCPKKISKKCSSTSKDCNHAVKHKENQFCGYSAGGVCADCVQVEPEK